MHFRQSGQRAERRRRVLMDEVVQQEGTVADESPREVFCEAPPTGTGGNYDAGALDACRYRLTDLVPTRPWTLIVLSLSVLALIAGVQALYAGVFLDPNFLIPRSLAAALDVTARGSLAAWLSSMLLAVAAAGAWLLFVLRRHRKDDYRGRYRIWIWASGGLLLGSLDAGTRLHDPLAVLLTRFTGTPLYGDGDAWWLALYGLVLGGLAIRMLVEVRHCRLAVLAMFGAGVCHAAAASLQLGLPPIDGGALQAMLQSTLTMLGHGLLLAAVTAFARYVYLDAQGKLPPRPPKAARTKKPRREKRRRAAGNQAEAGEEKPARSRRAASGRRARVDAEHAGRAKAARRKTDLDTAAADDPQDESGRNESPSGATSAGPERKRARAEDSKRETASDPGASGDDDDGQHDETAGLSKAERRRLRKLRRRQKQT